MGKELSVSSHPTATENGLIKFSRDGRLLAYSRRLHGQTLGRGDTARVAGFERTS